MRRIYAIVWLTWKAALRFRLFWVLAGMLACAVIFLPLILKDDGTARGFIQILLAYNLTVITALLGFSTLWLSCGSLARDMEECQIQMVAAKPIARWQIWIGKWLGIMLLNAVLLSLSGVSVYALLMYRASKLPRDQQEVLRAEVFVARAGLRPPVVDHSAEIEKLVRDTLKENAATGLDAGLLRRQIQEQVKYAEQIVRPFHGRRWTVDLGLRKNTLHDIPLFVRTKFYASETNASGTYLLGWKVAPDSPKERLNPMSMSAESFTEFPIPENMFDDNGRLTIEVVNLDKTTALLFPADEGLEVLYREAGFGLNFARGLAIIFCWLSLLAALGLAAASFLSFSVAAFFCLTMLLVGFSSGSMEDILTQKSVLGLINTNTGVADKQTIFDLVMLPVFRGLLSLVRLAEGFSPVDSLSQGRSITWLELGRAFGEIVLLLGGGIAATGIFLFSRRELAAVQASS